MGYSGYQICNKENELKNSENINKENIFSIIQSFGDDTVNGSLESGCNKHELKLNHN